jgi:hypothetical protein
VPARRPATRNVPMFACHSPPLCTAKLLSNLEINTRRDGCSRAACSSNRDSRQTEYAIRVTSPFPIQQLLKRLKLSRLTVVEALNKLLRIYYSVHKGVPMDHFNQVEQEFLERLLDVLPFRVVSANHSQQIQVCCSKYEATISKSHIPH